MRTVNAEILAEINRPKHQAEYRQWVLAEEIGLYPEADIFADITSPIFDVQYIDNYDDDDDDISIDMLRMIARSMGIPVDD